jgi:hypothetical protein
MDYMRLNQLGHELDAYWKQIHGLYLDSLIGFSVIYSKVQSEQDSILEWLKEFGVSPSLIPDELSFSYTSLLKQDFCASGIHEVTQGTVKHRNLPGGDNYRTLGQMCVVCFSDYWNEYLRKEYAIAKRILDPTITDDETIKDILKKNVKDDFWGDMTKLRNSIVHHDGKANANVDGCKIIKWFAKGDDINFSTQMMEGIFCAVLVSRNRLFSEALPKRTMTIPKWGGEKS